MGYVNPHYASMTAESLREVLVHRDGVIASQTEQITRLSAEVNEERRAHESWHKLHGQSEEQNARLRASIAALVAPARLIISTYRDTIGAVGA